MITSWDVRQKFNEFWEKKDHKLIPTSPLVLEVDTTLFTIAGMQQLVPYLSGTPHSLGKKLYNIQPCFRTVDIDEVGDNRHTTFFEMLGNWSLGDYFKAEQIPWMWEFYTKELGIDKEKIHVTVFGSGSGVARDEESIKIWQDLGLHNNHIHEYGIEKNWWSEFGPPEKMPVGKIGGVSTEVFFEFTDVTHDKKYGATCHPNCDCGRFLEIGNSVFIEYRKTATGLEELPQKNVDFGGGLERLIMAANNESDVFNIDLFAPIISEIESITGKKYVKEADKQEMRIIADHLKAATMMLVEGVLPSNKMQGYIVRRLLRRVAVKLYDLEGMSKWEDIASASNRILDIYDGIIFNKEAVGSSVSAAISQELSRFTMTLDRGIAEFNKLQTIDEVTAFNLFQTYGFPFEITEELARQKGINLDKKLFDEEVGKHQAASRSSSVGMFKGGLADHSEQTIKYHTATHLLHQALRDVLGDTVRQQGSNITGSRLRFDFSFDRKPTDEELSKVEGIINDKIKEALPVINKIMPKEEAEKLGAMSFFKDKYGDEVSIYLIGGNGNETYSKEFCGGPHVKNTSEIGPVKITKTERIGAGLIRIYAE